ncbi:carboxylesterase 4A-like isoform X2 [Pecten maximus]|uniref:carboxylesterase 4A-like isoform X2 n=1 Tax=Pecten maximus TaxID=6579 RepID=UPI00145883DB|nr:carboxylesterase 4A-like isoform X2 [Pecten maximus]
MPRIMMHLILYPRETSYKFFRSLDIIYGTCSSEGLVATIIADGLQKKYGFNATLEIPTIVLRDEFAPTISHYYYNSNEHVSRAIYDKYTSKDALTQSKNMIDVFTDYIFLASTVKALNSHSSTGLATGGNTFQFIFSAHGVLKGYVVPVYLEGAWHGAELPFLFGLDGQGVVVNKTADINAVTNTMITYWTNFAKHGNPNSHGLPDWPVYNPVTTEYLNINTIMSTGSHVAEDRMRLWNWYIPSLLKLQTSAILGK